MKIKLSNVNQLRISLWHVFLDQIHFYLHQVDKPNGNSLKIRKISVHYLMGWWKSEKMKSLSKKLTKLIRDLTVVNEIECPFRFSFMWKVCFIDNQSFFRLPFSSDRFAALLPFIGIVSTVIILVIGILLLEKHQKAKKKAAAAADEGTLDQANNP